jgi:flagellar biosynthesis chaperone FliJ
MKTRALLVVFAFVAATFVAVFSGSTSQAAELSEEQLGRISANCVSIQSSLNQLHASDGLLRVNRGQIYESIGSKLMNNFNVRLASNGQDNKGLVVVSDQYQTALSAFRSDYQAYEKQLTATMKIDCTKQQAAFHVSLEDARAKRSAVHEDVIRLNRYIDDYRTSVNDFMLNFQRVTGAN